MADDNAQQGAQQNQQAQQAIQGQQSGATSDGTATEDAAAQALLAKWTAEGAEDGKGGKTAVLADLASERKARQALEQQIADLKKSGDTQRDAFAKALGLKPEETSDTDKLAEQLTALSEQMASTQRKATLLEVAAEPGVDDDGNALPAIPKEYHNLLTATETEALQAQAKSIATLLKANSKAGETPGFAQSAGQGNNGNGKSPTVPEQVATAERELAGMTRGTPEHKQQSQRVMALKSQLLLNIHQNH